MTEFEIFFFIEEVAASQNKFIFNFLIDAFFNNDRLFAGADNAVIKGFTHNNGTYGHFNIRSSVNYYRGITRADADCRFAGAVSRVDHARAAGS